MAKKTFVELQKQIEQLQKEAEQIKQQEAEEVLGRIKEAIAVYGFSAADLGFGAASKRGAATLKKPGSSRGPKRSTKASGVAAPKYRDSEGNVWSGRGPRPAWFKAALDAGKSAEELLAK
jgi:DNA-binding protein H-NS